MATKGKGQYLKREVAFGGQNLTLYSLDGQVWSTRKDELEAIMERHASERASFGEQIVGGPQARVPTLRPKPTSIQSARMQAAPGTPANGAKDAPAPGRSEKKKAGAQPAGEAADQQNSAVLPKKRASSKPAVKKGAKSKQAVA